MMKFVHNFGLAAILIPLSSSGWAQSESTPASAPAPAPAPAVNQTAMVNITPLRLDMPSTNESEQMLLRNDSEVPLTVQVRLFGWNQASGEDTYIPSQDFLVSPSIITIAPRSTQTLHVVPNSARNSSAERSYRVVIDQLQAATTQVAGLAQTRLRVTIPLFSGGEQAAASSLEYSIRGNRLYVTNKGGRTARLTPLTVDLGPAKGGLNQLKDSPRYILPNATMSAPMPAAHQCDGNPVKISVVVDRRPFDAVASQICS